MAYRTKRRRGFGDVLNPTAGTALDCGLLGGGVFQKACWCLSFPSLCSSSDYQAAYALAHPEVYAPIQPPPVVGAPQPGQTPADVIAAQNAAWKAQNTATMEQTAANLKAAAQTQCPDAELIQNDDGSWSCPPSSGFPWWGWAAIAAGAIYLFTMPSPHAGYRGGYY